MLEAVEGRLCLLEVLEMLGVMCRVLLCKLEVVEGELRLLGGGGRGCEMDAWKREIHRNST
jgi:hypothetical protein